MCFGPVCLRSVDDEAAAVRRGSASSVCCWPDQLAACVSRGCGTSQQRGLWADRHRSVPPTTNTSIVITFGTRATQMHGPIPRASSAPTARKGKRDVRFRPPPPPPPPLCFYALQCNRGVPFLRAVVMTLQRKCKQARFEEDRMCGKRAHRSKAHTGAGDGGVVRAQDLHWLTPRQSSDLSGSGTFRLSLYHPPPPFRLKRTKKKVCATDQGRAAETCSALCSSSCPCLACVLVGVYPWLTDSTPTPPPSLPSFPSLPASSLKIGDAFYCFNHLKIHHEPVPCKESRRAKLQQRQQQQQQQQHSRFTDLCASLGGL